MKKITIILPAHNEEESINLLEEQMLKVGKENPEYDWGFLLVNDGSTDRTLERYAQLCDKDNRFSYIDLSRNYGKEIAMLAGLDYALGDAVIIMDADMQHPINVIPEMLHYFEEGYDDVYAQRAKSEEKWFKRKSSSLYYRILEKMASIPVQKDTGDFRLLNRNCIEALKKMREVERNTKGLYGWIGFHKKCIKYEQLERQFGETKWSMLALIKLALNGITTYTTAPLRLASMAGMFISLIAFIYLVYIIFQTMCFGENVKGYPTIMITILFLGGVQLISLGIIGEYLGRTYNEAKNRPAYFINEYKGKIKTNESTKEVL